MRFAKLPMLAILLFFFACSSEELTYRVETRDGVRHVINTGTAWKDGEGVKLEFVRTIGDFEGEDENYIFFNLRDLALDNDGNLYILDAGNNRVQVFDTDRKYIRTIGRKGQGPGEFDRPFALNINAEGMLYVTNGSSRNIIVLDPLGNEVKRVPCPSSNDVMRFLPESNQLLAVTGNRMDGGINNDKHKLFYIFDGEGNVLKSFGDPLFLNLEINERKLTYTLGRDHITINPEGNFFASKPFNNLISQYDFDGNLLMSFERLLDYPIKEPTFSNTQFDATHVTYSINFDKYNRVWVATFHSQPDKDTFESKSFNNSDYMYFEIFDSNGVLLDYLPIPTDMRYFWIFGDRMFIIDSNTISVSEYRIKELN